MIEDAAHHDGVVRRIVMSQALARVHLAPCHLRPGQQPVKETLIQVVENFLEVIDMPSRRSNAFAAPNLPHQVRLGGDVVA